MYDIPNLYIWHVFLARAKKIKRAKKINGPKTNWAGFEARERADFNCLSGAGGPESILSVVGAPKPENGSPESPFSVGFIRFYDEAETYVICSENIMLFLYFWGHFAEKSSKASISDRFYNVFCSTFSAAPKRCVSNGYLMFPKSKDSIKF